MDLKSYYTEMREKERKLTTDFPDGVIYITSLFYRERNSTPGCTTSATCINAARCLTDGTHRLATKEEIEAFIAHQQEELAKNTQAEQAIRKQYIVVVPSESQQATFAPTVRSTQKKAVAVAE